MFDDEAAARCYRDVRKWALQLYGPGRVSAEPGVGLAVAREGVLVRLTVSSLPYRAGPALGVESTMVQGASLGPEALAYLVAQSSSLPLGAYAVSDRDVVFRVTIPGNGLARDQLRDAVELAMTAVRSETERMARMCGGAPNVPGREATITCSPSCGCDWRCGCFAGVCDDGESDGGCGGATGTCACLEGRFGLAEGEHRE